MGCALWLVAIQSNPMLVESFGFVGGWVAGGMGGGMTAYILFPFKSPSDNPKISLYRRYFKIRFLVSVIFLHGILIFIVPPPSYPPGPHEVRIELAHLETLLNLYRLDYWEYPTTEQGLKVLVNQPVGDERLKRWHGPYGQEESLTDPWGNDFQYQSDGTTYEIISFGPDGRAGGGDDVRVVYLGHTLNK